MENKVLKVYRNLSIRSKLLLVLYIQITIPLILIGFISYRISSGIIQDKFISYSQDILSTIEIRMEDYVANINTLSQDFLYDQTVYDYLNTNAKPGLGGIPLDVGKNVIENYETKNRINQVLKKFVNTRPEIQSVCLYTNKGEPSSYDNNSKKTRIYEIVNFGDTREIARQGNGKVVWCLDRKNGNVNNIYLTRIIRNRDNYEEIGLLVMLVKKEFLESIYKVYKTSVVQNVAIISSDGQPIVSMNPADRQLLQSIVKKSDENRKGYFTDSKSNSLISYVSMKEPDWKIVTYIPLDELYKEVGNLGKWVIILCIISVIMLSILSVYISFDFTRPISRIVKGMTSIEKGQAVIEYDDERKDELGYLNKSFNNMAKEIDYLVKEIYQEQLTRTEAELKALQAQINPHFLFNTLESINWMAQLNNVPEISDTVSALASLMEASIGRDDKLITLKEEFDYIDNYILIMKKRYEDRIEFITNLQKEAEPVLIPKLLIQPLIENAVYHGIDRIRQKGSIYLEAYISDVSLIIEILDNGAGIEKDELKDLNENLAKTNDEYFRNLAKKRNTSIGIENVNRRIKLFYGERYGLRIESEPGKYTKVIVTVPVRLDNIEGEKNV